MSTQKVGIIVECICDLPKNYLREHEIDVVYFLITTDSGVFYDTYEVTAENILGYMNSGGSLPVSCPPPPETYAELFRKNIEKYGEAIFIATGSGASDSYSRAVEALELMGSEVDKIHVIDSKHLSTGLGHIIITAVELAESGCSAKEIIDAIEGMTSRVSTTFITVNADYLYRNGHTSGTVKKLSSVFGIHPVLMMKNGALALKSLFFGNYQKASLRYVRRELKKTSKINKTRIFITHVGCSLKDIERIKAEINRCCKPEKIVVTRASATISVNCGPGTFGVLFVNEKEA